MVRCLLCPFPWPLQGFKSFRNCYLAGFQHPLKPSKASKPFLLGFETALWHFRSATSCFYWASKLLSGTFSAPPTFPWPFQSFKSFRSCYLAGFQHPLKFSKASKPFLLGFETALSVGLRNCSLALPKRHKLFLLGFETAIWHVFSTPNLSMALSKLQKLQKLLSGRFSAPLKILKGLKTLSVGLRNCSLCWASKLLPGTSEAPQAVSIGLRFLLGFETATWHVFSTP